MNSIRSTLATVWRIAAPYFRSEDRWAGGGLLAAVIAIELAIVAITVLINQWNSRFYNALQERNWDAFVSEIIYFSVLAAIFIVLAVYQLYLNQWLQIRWRRWMTSHYLGEWLHDANHYRMQLEGDAADNPDQRMTDDVKLFVDRTLNIGVGLLSSIVTLASFVVILWGLSNEAPLHVFGREFAIPGYLVWGALIYSVLGTILTHMIGWPLVGIDYRQQQYEADFRFNLVRVRENSEQIALLNGEDAERERLLVRFRRVVDNWLAIMSRTKKITAFTASYNQASVIFPYVLVAPAYFANKIQLGGMMQTASAFSSVQGALSFFISIYRQLAEWQAVVNRLDGFEAGIAGGRELATRREGIHVTQTGDGAIDLKDLALQLPNGTPLVNADKFSFRKGERTLMTGPSGSGKSTLFRAIAGIWPFGKGRIGVQAGATLLVLPQKPYLPFGTLAEVLAYPAKPDAYDPAALGAALDAVGLSRLGGRLGEEASWPHVLSLGEQQRVSLARALLMKPDILLLDESTSAIDEEGEATLYRLIEAQLPNTTVMSIGHRSTLLPFHKDRLEAKPQGDGVFRLAPA